MAATSTMRCDSSGKKVRAAGLILAGVAALRSSLSFVAGGALEGAVLAQRRAPALGAGVAPESAAPGPLSLAMGVPLVGVAAAVAVSRRSRSSVITKATRTEWYRKVKRVGGDQALFDVTIKKPLGIKMEKFPQREGIGISEVVAGSNTDDINRKVCVDDEPGMWVLEGDRVMAINGIDTEDETIDKVVEIVGNSEGEEVTLTLMRNTRKGPIKVVMMPDGDMTTVRRNSRLSAAAEWAKGMELKYGCIDGWCGTCWHRERTTNGIFKPCCDVLTSDWDNVVPLVLTPKPEKAGDSTFLNPRGV